MECVRGLPRGQFFLMMGTPNRAAGVAFRRIGQTIPIGRSLAILIVWGFLQAGHPPLSAQLVDPLDAYPPRWRLAGSDCDARVVRQDHDPNGGLAGGGCETLTLRFGHGTRATLEYRLEPTRVINELTARVYVRSQQPGVTIGLRVRFPRLLDPETGQSLAVILPGASYRELGAWQQIGIGMIEQPLRLKTYALRQTHGPAADLGDPFVDAVVLNAYTGPGETTLGIDQLTVDGMVPLVSMRSLAAEAAAERRTSPGEGMPAFSMAATGQRQRVPRAAFPSGQVTRILQHNGEPLDWLKSLGFDAVLLPKPVDRSILSEAIRTGMKIYAPPLSAPDPALVPLLEPLAGHYLGTSLSLTRLPQVSAGAERLAAWPEVWQRPLIAAPVEAIRRYATIADGLVFDLPAPIRGLAATEEIALLRDSPSGPGLAGVDVVGIRADVPAGLSSQLDGISGAIGAPRGNDLFWHPIWLQVARALQSAPRAILFRSDHPLTGGRMEDQSRSIALSYVNRYLDAVGGMIAAGKPGSELKSTGPAYQVGRVSFPGGHLVIATSRVQQRGLALAGDGDVLRIDLPEDQASPIPWRLSHFTAERLSVQRSRGTAYVELVSPDLVETIVLANDPLAGGRLARTLVDLGERAATDRLQLSREGLERIRADWQLAVTSRIVPAVGTTPELLRAAEQSLRDAEPMLRSGDAGSALRMVRRGDAWALRAQWQLHADLSPGRAHDLLVSCPPLLSAGGLATQVMWWPLMSDEPWGDNRLIGGSLDSADLLGDAGWVVGKRPDAPAGSESEVGIVAGPQVEGTGCLLATVTATTPRNLPGGYAGTTLQIRSPAVRFEPKTAIRIDARIRTLGFGGSDQGVLVYDSIAGPELGVLVRATPQWQTVRLYRQTLDDAEVTVRFELIGAGEVAIDDVQIRAWSPRERTATPLPRRLD